MRPAPPVKNKDSSSAMSRFFGVFRYSKEAIDLVWTTDKRLTLLILVLTIFAGVIPGGIAWVGSMRAKQAELQLIYPGVSPAAMLVTLKLKFE